MLKAIYVERLMKMLAAEKKYISCLKKLSAAAFTDELRTGISPGASDQELHIQRLKQCAKMHMVGKVGEITAIDSCLLECGKDVIKGKGSSLDKDLRILFVSQQIFHQKIQVYSALQHMAIALGFDQDAPLLEECFKDDSNAYQYLVQISQNIVYPEFILQTG